MMTLEKIKALESLKRNAQRELNNASIALYDALDEYAMQTCPFNIGDKVLIPGRYVSHAGKTMVIDFIKRVQFDWQGSWVAVGRLLKKDGSVGLLVGELTEKNWLKGNKNQC